MELTPAIILIIVAVIAGYVIGIVDSRITASLRKKTEDKAGATPSPAPQPAAEEKNRLGEHTVLRVSIDQALKWHIDLDKVQVDDPNTISAEQRQRLVSLITQIRPWIDGKAGQTITSPPAATEPELPPAMTPSLAPKTPAASSSPAPKIDPMRGLRSLLNNEIKTPAKTASIVTMIDDVLQARLLNSPLLTRSIRLEEGRTGELIVLVGSTRYNSVDEVPEPEIRAIIKTAISDWEKK